MPESDVSLTQARSAHQPASGTEEKTSEITGDRWSRLDRAAVEVGLAIHGRAIAAHPSQHHLVAVFEPGQLHRESLCGRERSGPL